MRSACVFKPMNEIIESKACLEYFEKHIDQANKYSEHKGVKL